MPRFRERPAEPASSLSAIAVCVLPSSLLQFVGEHLDGGNPYAPRHFLAWLSQRLPPEVSRLIGHCLEIGSVEDLERAQSVFGHRGW